MTKYVVNTSSSSHFVPLVAALMEPQTTEPVDTMNLSAMPIIEKKEETKVIQDEVDPTELRLMLFPSQIQKISSLIALMAHQRDLLQRLQVALQSSGGGPLMEGLEWKSQLQYVFEADTNSITIRVGAQEYFEFFMVTPVEIVLKYRTDTVYKAYMVTVIIST